MWRREGVRRDKVMGDIRMHGPHDMDTYTDRSELSKDARESESTRTKRRAAVDRNGGSNFARRFEAAYPLPLDAKRKPSIDLHATNDSGVRTLVVDR